MGLRSQMVTMDKRIAIKQIGKSLLAQSLTSMAQCRRRSDAE
jgi:hypothetical protein